TAEREHFEKNFCTTDARRQLVELTDSVLQAAQPGQYPIQSTAARSASSGRAPWAAMAASILIALGLAGYTVYSLRTERAASQRRAEDLEQRLAQLQVPTVQPISFLLSATATRTAGESSGPLVIPSTASSVTLEVFPELKGYPSWSLTLENVAGQQLWSGMATASGSKQTVSANVPASVLDAGPKTARLHGLDPQGKSVLAGVYVFTVARR
ncbi:MAG TPA: hypothetical protein VEQ63_11455, partial [Bryobacteraceae bacterium]|nr:hypothetical protein [Bryobacteraceae bacterium]